MGASPHPLLLCVCASRSAGFDGALGNTKLDGSIENCFNCGVMQEPTGTSAFSWRHSFSVIGTTESLSFLKENIQRSSLYGSNRNLVSKENTPKRDWVGFPNVGSSEVGSELWVLKLLQIVLRWQHVYVVR